MLYTGYEINRTMLATMGRVAQFNSELLLNPANPWSRHVASPVMARALEPRGKPAPSPPIAGLLVKPADAPMTAPVPVETFAQLVPESVETCHW